MKRNEMDWILLAMTLFEATAFAMLAFYNGFDFVPLILAVSMPLLLIAQIVLLGRAFPHMDRIMLSCANFLCGLGIIMLYRLDPEKALKQLLFYGLGVMAMVCMTVMVARMRRWRWLRLPAMLLSVGLLALTLVIGKETYGAKNWIDLKFFSLQPSEFVKIALIVCLALDLSRKRTLRELAPVGVFAALCVGLIVLQKDLGAVLICFLTCLTVYYVATSNALLALSGIACAAAGSAVLYRLFPHVQTRVAIWKNPWASPQDGGYQIIQSLIAIASGGMTGLGLRQGHAHGGAGGGERFHLCCAVRGVRHRRRAVRTGTVCHSVLAGTDAGHAGAVVLSCAVGCGRGDLHEPADLHDRRRRDQAHPAHGRDHALYQLRRLVHALLYADAGDSAGRIGCRSGNRRRPSGGWRGEVEEA